MGEKHYVFSARTTEEGLRLLNQLRSERKIGWDELVIDAVCERYGLDRAAVALPKKGRPAEEKRDGEPPMEEEESRLEVGQDGFAEAPAKKRGKGKARK